MINLDYICDVKRHLVCRPYSIENLHIMAEQLKIHRCWFHKSHYDIPKRRKKEITDKCRIVPTREILRIVNGEYNWEL